MFGRKHSPAPSTQAATDQALAAHRDGDRPATMDALRRMIETAPPEDLDRIQAALDQADRDR